MKLRRIAAGIYETPDGVDRIVRTDWDGPRGGIHYLWEFASKDRFGQWCIDGPLPRYTLREARLTLARLRESLSEVRSK